MKKTNIYIKIMSYLDKNNGPLPSCDTVFVA